MYHYDAFISYNHNPRDIKVTSSLQQKLENYRLPKGTKTSTGKDKIERVFLDKGELEVAGDLSEILQNALDNADKLVVICSPESRESIWVHREIEYFLRSHPVSDVYTVITEGEPVDVIPEILLSEETEDEDGNIVTKSREPLSCDFRMPLRQANRQELPRLVAAIVGCRYDDLVQRQKQYRMKRQIAMLAAAGVLLSTAIGYLAWSNHKIRESLNNTLREESINLAIQSEQALGDGDRLGAIRYALEALPSEEKNRPVVARAVMALSSAIDLYKTPNSEKWSAVRQYDVNGEGFQKMRTATVSDRTFFAELLDNGKVVLWDTDTGSEIMADSTGISERVRNIEFTDDGKLVAVSETKIYVLDPVEEKVENEISLGDELELPFYYGNISSLCDSLAIKGSSLWIPARHLHYDEDTNETETTYFLLRIDLSTGKTAERHAVPKEPQFIRVSSDGRYLAYGIPGYEYGDSFEYHEGDDTVYIVDTQDEDGFDKARTMEVPAITGMDFYDGPHLVLSSIDSRPTDDDLSQHSKIDYVGIGRRTRYSIGVERNIDVCMLDASSGQKLWDHDFSAFGSGVPALEFRGEGQTGWDIICNMGSTLLVMDSDGNELAQFNIPGLVEGYYSRDDLIRIVTDSGSMVAYDLKTGKLTTVYDILVGPVGGADATEDGNSIFVASIDTAGMSQAEKVTQYMTSGVDEAWEAYEYGADTAMGDADDKDVERMIVEHASDGRIVEISYNDNESLSNDKYVQILVRNSDDGNVLLNKVLQIYHRDEDNYDKYINMQYSGISEAGDKVYFADISGIYDEIIKLKSVDLSDGSEEEIEAEIRTPEAVYTNYDIMDSDYTRLYHIGEYSIKDGKIHYLAHMSVKNDKYYLKVLSIDLETGETVTHNITELSEYKGSTGFRCKINAACERVLYMDPGGDEEKLVCCDFDGNIIWENASVPEALTGIMLKDDGSAVVLEGLEDKAVLHFYDDKNGKETASTEIEGVNVLNNERLGCVLMPGGEEMITTSNNAFILDADTKEVMSMITGTFAAYDPYNEIFVLKGGYDRNLGHVPYRSVEDMIEMGQKYVQTPD